MNELNPHKPPAHKTPAHRNLTDDRFEEEARDLTRALPASKSLSARLTP